MRFFKRYKLIITLSLLALLSLGVFFYTQAQGGPTPPPITITPNLQKGLVGHWTMDEVDYNSTTERMSDKSAYGNHATNYGATFTEDRFGNYNGAMGFNGVPSTYLQFNNPLKQANLEQEWSVSAWVNITGTSTNQDLITGLNRGLSLIYGATDRLILYLNSGANDYYLYSDSANLLVNQGWKHVVFIFRNSDSLRKIYINNEDKSGYGPNKTNTPLGLSTLFKIGVGVNGHIDDVRFYNRALSEEEISQLYETNKPRLQGSSLQKGLIGHWTLDKVDHNSSTNEIKDLSAYANHGINTKTSLANNRLGNSNSAIQFNENQENLLMNYRVWKDGQIGSIGEFRGWELGNKRIIAEDPWGRDVVVWASGEGGNISASNGGIYHDSQPIENTKLYRMSWWEKRVTNANGTYGRYYAGLNGYGSTNGVLNLSNSTYNTNPYFWYTTHDGLVEGQWFLVVGHVFPYTHSGTSRHPDSGRYTVEDGFIGNTNADYKWSSVTTSARSRTLAVYKGNDINMLHYTVYPRMEIVDGTEPSIEDLLNGHDSYGGDVVMNLSDNVESISFWYKKDGEEDWTHLLKSSTNYYINKELGVPDIFPIVINNNKMYIGRTSMSDYFDGQIDDVRIYNRALSAQEIDLLYSLGH